MHNNIIELSFQLLGSKLINQVKCESENIRHHVTFPLVFTDIGSLAVNNWSSVHALDK